VLEQVMLLSPSIAREQEGTKEGTVTWFPLNRRAMRAFPVSAARFGAAAGFFRRDGGGDRLPFERPFAKVDQTASPMQLSSSVAANPPWTVRPGSGERHSGSL
jgi:hypothetical protein